MLNRGARSEANKNTLQSERAERARKTRANEVSYLGKGRAGVLFGSERSERAKEFTNTLLFGMA